MTLTRLPSGRRASQIGLELVDATADLADDALADVHQLRIVGEPDRGPLDLAAHFDIGRLGAVDHDVGDVVASEQWLERSIAQHVVADVLEQLLLLGDRHHHVLDGDDLADDVANFLARRLGIELGELGQVDRVDERVEDRGLDVVILLRAGALDRLALGLGGRLGHAFGAASVLLGWAAERRHAAALPALALALARRLRRDGPLRRRGRRRAPFPNMAYARVLVSLRRARIGASMD